MCVVFLDANPMQLQKNELIFCIDVVISAQAVEGGHVFYRFGPELP